jgi:hypothetical protein
MKRPSGWWAWVKEPLVRGATTKVVQSAWAGEVTRVRAEAPMSVAVLSRLSFIG